MSFSYSALGTKEEVVAQLAKINTYDNAIGDAAKQLVSDALGADNVQPYAGYELKYTVNASGHSGGGSPLSLNLTVVGSYVPVVNVTAPPEGSADPPGSPLPA